MTNHDLKMMQLAQIAAKRSGKQEKITNKIDAVKMLKYFINFKTEMEKDLFLKSVCRFFLEIEKIKQPENAAIKLAESIEKREPRKPAEIVA